MRTLTTFLILLTISLASLGQINYEKGYLINNDRKRVDCLIKNEEWKNNPSEFSYKLTPSSAPVVGNLATVREFGLNGSYKYVNANVKIDLQTKPAIGPKNELISVWTRERLFLKVLQEGKAKLYSYDNNKLERFFYSLNDTAVIQLIYLETLNGQTLIKNTGYQQQLWSSVKAPNATMNSIKEINYTQKDFENYFRTFNESFGSVVQETSQVKKKSYFNLKLSPGLNSSSVSMSNVVDYQNQKSNTDFGSKMSFGIGLEAELILPVNKYRWGIVFEPSYQSYKGEGKGVYGPSNINYSSVVFPIGLRYYIPLNEKTKVFLNGFLVPGFAVNMNSTVDYYTYFSNVKEMKSVDISSSGNAAVGGGIEYKRFSLEARYYTNRNLLKDQPSESADYGNFSVVLGYKFLKTRFK